MIGPWKLIGCTLVVAMLWVAAWVGFPSFVWVVLPMESLPLLTIALMALLVFAVPAMARLLWDMTPEVIKSIVTVMGLMIWAAISIPAVYVACMMIIGLFSYDPRTFSPSPAMDEWAVSCDWTETPELWKCVDESLDEGCGREEDSEWCGSLFDECLSRAEGSVFQRCCGCPRCGKWGEWAGEIVLWCAR